MRWRWRQNKIESGISHQSQVVLSEAGATMTIFVKYIIYIALDLVNKVWKKPPVEMS